VSTAIWRWVRYAWIACSLLVLVVALAYHDGKANSGADLVMALGMLTLSFPSGVILSWIVGVAGRLVFEQTGAFVSSGYLALSVSWLVLFGVGYWQWFVVIPWIWRRWAKRPEQSEV
jgi:hypothetical protein